MLGLDHLSEAIERLKANYTNDEEEREEAGYIEPVAEREQNTRGG
jgi:hypothetical protein